MLIIKEAVDKQAAQAFLDALGVCYCLADDIVMVCEERGSVSGVTSLCLREGRVYLNLLAAAEEMNDMSFLLGLAKALMNLADLRGIKTLYGSQPELAPIYRALRFQEKDGEFCVSLEGYFTAGHEHKQEVTNG